MKTIQSPISFIWQMEETILGQQIFQKQYSSQG